MKILHYTSSMKLERGGVVKAVLDLCTLTQSEHEVGLATCESGGVPEEWLNNDPSTTVVHTLPGERGPYRTLSKVQRERLREVMTEYDVVHMHAIWDPANPQVAAICKELGKPYVLSLHGMFDHQSMAKSKARKWVFLNTWGRNLIRDASLIHCTAETELKQSTTRFDGERARLAPLHLNLDIYTNLPDPRVAYEAFERLDPELPKVLFLSRLHPVKGVDRLIRASAILKSRGIKHQLVLAGTGDADYTTKLRTLADSEGVSGHTYFLGFVSGVQKAALYHACDVFALPTEHENFGFVSFESIASGTFAITTKDCGTWRELEESTAGLAVDNSPLAFANALETVLANPTEYNARGKAGREWLFREFDADKTRGMYTAIYNELVGQATDGAAR